MNTRRGSRAPIGENSTSHWSMAMAYASGPMAPITWENGSRVKDMVKVSLKK